MAATMPPPKKGTIQSFIGALTSRPDRGKKQQESLQVLREARRVLGEKALPWRKQPKRLARGPWAGLVTLQPVGADLMSALTCRVSDAGVISLGLHISMCFPL